jgi:hypothetical protein
LFAAGVPCSHDGGSVVFFLLSFQYRTHQVLLSQPSLVGSTMFHMFGAWNLVGWSRIKILTNSYFFVSSSLSLPQSVHFTGTELEQAAAEFSTDQKMTSYLWDKSSVQDDMVFPTTDQPTPASSYLNVWNEGTPEYETMGMGAFDDALPFQEIMDEYYPRDGNPDKRGNLQVNFGFAGGRSHEKRTSEQVLVDYGVAVPSTRTGTMDPLVVETFKVMSDLAKRVGVAWTCPKFLEENPAVVKRLDRFAHKIHKGVCLEQLGFLFSVLDGETQTHEHTDGENCPELSQVVLCSRIMKNPFGQ